MNFSIATQIVARALIWIFVFAFEIVQIDLVKEVPYTHVFYVVLCIASMAIFAVTLYFSDNLLMRDIRELCFYDVIVQLIGLFLHLHHQAPTLFEILCYVVLLLKVGRLLWFFKTPDGIELCGWPIFGFVGLCYKQLGLNTRSGGSARHDYLVYLGICLVIALTTSVYAVGRKMPPLSLWAFLAAILIAFRFKRFMAYLEGESLRQIETAKRLAVAEANAVAKTALADSAVALAKANEQLQALNVQREMMLADIQVKNATLLDAAHDLMQPIMKIQSEIVEAVATNDHAARARLGLSLQARVSDYARAINDTIYAAKITTSAQAPNIRPCALARLRSETAEELIDLAEAHECDLVVRASVRYPDYFVLTDEDIFGRILANLVTNALKHSGSKWVLVTMRKLGQQCVVAVRDQGRGIDCAGSVDHAANFMAFADTIKARTRRGEVGNGHGIGVNNVKQLCASLGSQIRLFSRPGCGSVFYFVLPMAQVDAALN
jgi:signal transduction histidine kinase